MRNHPNSHFYKTMTTTLLVLSLTACSGGSDGSSDSNTTDTQPNPIISSNANMITGVSPIPLSINFGEAVTGLTLNEIDVSNGVAGNLLDTDGQNYTVEITPAMDGIVQVSLIAGVAQDATNNASLASNNFSITYQTPSATILYQENFDTFADGTSWPAAWAVADSSPVVSATIQSGQACMEGLVLTGAMNPSGQNNLARMVNTTLSAQDFEARYQLIYEDFQNQGAGFYGRQNGGFLDVGSNDPKGQGYVFFLKGFSADQLTFWYEIAGDEIPHHELSVVTALNVSEGSLIATTINVAYQVQQISTTETQQRAKIWLDGTAEPVAWQIVSDATGTELPGTNPQAIPVLQNLSGGFAVDLYNASNPSIGNPATQSLCIDNLIISVL